MAQVEDVLLLGQEPESCEESAELAHLVPEEREVAVLDVEVVVLDEREDRAGERQALVERPAFLLGQEGAVLLGDPLSLGQHPLEGARDVLARLEPLDVGADRGDRQRRVVDPGAMVVVEAVSVRVVEPGILRLLVVGEPRRARLALLERRAERCFVVALFTAVPTPSSSARRARRRSSSSGRSTSRSIPETILATVWSVMSGNSEAQS